MPHINNFFSGGDNDLSKVNDNLSENFNESPWSLESMFLRSNDIMPVTHKDTPTQRLKENMLLLKRRTKNDVTWFVP